MIACEEDGPRAKPGMTNEILRAFVPSCEPVFPGLLRCARNDSGNSMTHRFNPTILREYDIRGIVGSTLTEADAYALLADFSVLPAKEVLPKLESACTTIVTAR